MTELRPALYLFDNGPLAARAIQRPALRALVRSGYAVTVGCSRGESGMFADLPDVRIVESPLPGHPTGALADRKALRYTEIEAPVEKTRSVCTYCGVGCSIDFLSKGDKLVGVQPAMDGPANEGALCIKGQFAYDFVQHGDRLKTPLVRNEAGELVPASWEDALDRAAEGFMKASREHGRHSVYAISSGRAPNEANYTTQKFIRAGFATNHVDNCSRG